MTHSLLLVKPGQRWYIAEKTRILVRMKTFVSPEALARLKSRARHSTILFLALIGGSLLLFIVLCLLTRTGNARTMVWTAFISMTLLGWSAIWLCAGRVLPDRAEARHIEMLLSGEPETAEGVLSLSETSFRIPKSVRVRSVSLRNGEDIRRLNLDDRFTGSMPPDGTEVRVQAVNGYITGAETLSGDPEDARPVRRPSRIRSFIRRFFSLFPLMLLWMMAVVMFGGFVFNQITDTVHARKIVIYADCEVTDAAALAARLEEGLPAPIRMVKVHPFTYAMFGSGSIASADLYIVPASHVPDYRDWFRSPPEGTEGAVPVPGAEDLSGIPVFIPGGIAAAAEYFAYDPAETWFLLFGSASPHMSGNEGAADGLAAEAARLLLSVQ